MSTTACKLLGLRFHTLVPAAFAELGAADWDGVVPLGRTGAGAGQAGGPSPLALRRRYYWSMRFSVWDATNYMANSTQRLKLALNDTNAEIYTNFNVRVTRS